MARGILAALAGAVLMFIWGALTWMVLHLYPHDGFKNGEVVSASLKASNAETGVYWVPTPPGTDDRESPEFKEFARKLKDGPRAMVIYNANGMDANDMTFMAKGFLALLASCFVAALMLDRAAIRNLLGRVLFCTTIGVIVALYSDGSNWAFFSFPQGWTIISMIDHVISWTLAGVAMGLIMKPRGA